MDKSKCFFHVDLDAFFASVEQLLHPEYRGKPVIVSGDPHKKRNVVSTASYEARKYGVHSAMPSIKAYELCPHGIFVEPDMESYIEYSEKVMNILYDFSPDVLQLSIDEACLDMTGTERLFGPPEEAAKKLKDRVKNETGLTISVGIASNSYLAKICSEIKKPDGMFCVKPGQEEDFMSKLPLKDVWGVGEKTLQRLESLGFKTVKDISIHSKAFLESIFGKASSSFLYNVSRGLEPENFRSEPKSHSLSRESTFEFDLTDINTIETALLDLSEQVTYRLLNSSITSKTVQLKIRYEDFTTVNCQQTYETPILCTADLYSRILQLFKKKYESGRGIRLLGVGVHNSIPVNELIQPELFESENIKKQQVEKAILQLENTHPEIKISKARLLKTFKVIALVFITALTFTNTSYSTSPDSTVRPNETISTSNNAALTNGESLKTPKQDSSKTSLFSSGFGTDSSIEFLADGYWNLKLSDTVSSTFGYGNEFTTSFNTPVFEQEVDLSIWFLLNNCFYIQGAFADKFNKNTFTVGYNTDGTIKEIKASNRNIVFPEIYSLTPLSRSIGGGDNHSPGISTSLAKDKWRFDASIRYDMLSSFDKTYYGRNAVTNIKIPASNFLTGSIYIIPGNSSIQKILSIYIESPEGSFTDNAGFHYKKLSSSDYLLFPNKNQILLSSDAGAQKRNGILPRVIVEFDQDAYTLLSSELGTFGKSNSPGSGYLGSIQKFFSKKVNVTEYSYSGKSIDGTISIPDKSGTKIDGYFSDINHKTMLLVQNTTGFSPFQAAYRYDGGSSDIQDALVASYSTENQNNKYKALIANSIDILNSDFFKSKHTFIDIYDPEITLSSTGVSGKITYLSPEINFPMADINPGIYLGYSSSNDDCVMLKSFSQSTRIEIGTKAVPGTVTVYKNGVIDSTAKYNPQTGEISLSSGITDSDKLYITWYEETSDYQTGMIAFASGFKYDILESLSADVALASRWAINPDHNFAEYKKTNSGYVTLSTGITYTSEKIKTSNITGLTFSQDNVSGKYRIFGFDNATPSTAYLIQDAERDLPPGFAPFLNPRTASSYAIELSDTMNCSVAKQTGITDKGISGYSIPVSYNFTKHQDCATGDILWASNTIITSANKNLLSNTSKFELAVKLSQEFIDLINQKNDIDTKVYLQLGVNSAEDFKVEHKGNIPTWKIFDTSDTHYTDVISPIQPSLIPDVKTQGWQTVSVILKDSDRAFFDENYNARIIITAAKKNSSAILSSGTIFIGPYQAFTQGIFTYADDYYSIYTEELKQINSDAAIFNKDTNYAQYINWDGSNHNFADTDNTDITIQKYFDEVDLSSYKKISLYFNYNVDPDSKKSFTGPYSDSAFTLVLDRNAPEILTTGSKALELSISQNELSKYISQNSTLSVSSSMHRLDIDRITGKVYIDGNEIAYSSLQINPNIIPTRMNIKISSVVKPNGESVSNLYTKGTFGIDELYLSDSSPKLIAQNLTKVSLEHKGSVLKIGDFDLISNPSLSANSELSGTFFTACDFENKLGISGNLNADVNVASIKLKTEIGRNADSKNILSSAGHQISTTLPLFNLLTFEENFTDNIDEAIVNKNNWFQLNLSSFKIPLILKASTKVSSDNWSVTQENTDSISLTIGNNIKYSLLADAKTYQKLSPYKADVVKIKSDNYFESYGDSTKFQFSMGSPEASNRTTGGTIKNTLSLPFANFAPQINFSEAGSYSSGNQTLFSDTTGFSTVFPFKINNQNFSFTYSKNSKLVQNVTKGGDYSTDIQNICQGISKRNWYFVSGPFYDLFSADLANMVLNTIPGASKQSELPFDEIAQSVNYNCKYDFSWKRPLFANRYDVFIPNIASLSIARDISTAENIADTYQIKATLGYTAVNIFSKDGSFPLLKWCESDEYNISFQSALKIPRTEPENIKQNYNLYLQANFYQTGDDVIRTGFQFSFQDANNWNTKASVLYHRASHFTPILEAVKLFNKKYDYSNLKILRNDSLNISVASQLADSTNARLRQYQSFDISHDLEIYFLKTFALTTNLSAEFSHTKDEIFNLNFTFGLGGKFNF